MCLPNIWYAVAQFPSFERKLIIRSRHMNRDPTVYVGSGYSMVHCLISHPQGADADDFNPARFIDADGQMTPALPGTKDGASPSIVNILLHADPSVFHRQKVIARSALHPFYNILLTHRSRIIRKLAQISFIWPALIPLH